MRSSMVKYSRGQSADAPRRRTCPVIVLPDFSFHSQTFRRTSRGPGRGAKPLGVELSFNDDLRGDAGVVGAGNEHGVVARHAVVAHQAVHDGLVEGMAHVQCARHVGRRELDHIGRGFRPRFTCWPAVKYPRFSHSAYQRDSSSAGSKLLEAPGIRWRQRRRSGLRLGSLQGSGRQVARSMEAGSKPIILRCNAVFSPC